MVTTGAVTLVMVAVVLLGNGLIPPKWRGGACLMTGVCPMNPGVGLTPEREGWAPGQAKDTMEGKCSVGPAGPVS